MQIPKKHPKEAERLALLQSYSVLDSLPEEDYDNLTSLAAQICGTPISLVTLIDRKRQWFKSHHGLEVSETPREYAFCAHAINGPDRIFQIEDSRKDKRFQHNPLVDGDPNVIFYAGVPLTDSDGLPLGTICVIDNKPNKLDEQQIEALKILSNQVMNLLELRKKKMELERVNNELVRSNRELEKFAYLAAHDLQSPLKNISALTGMLKENMASTITESDKEIVDMIKLSSEALSRLIVGILEYSRPVRGTGRKNSKVNLRLLVNKIGGLFSELGNSKINLVSELETMYTNRWALERILINLFANAIKYGDKATTEIDLKVEALEAEYLISFSDNGPGIPKKYYGKIFDLFGTLSNTDRFGQQGTGIGLATVRKTVEDLGGVISVDSKTGEGTTFKFTLKRQ